MPGRENVERLEVAVLDMQPIDPPIGGGRIRLLGLYHGLGKGLPTTYVGAYDWRGPEYRAQQLTANLKEIVVPLSDAHFAVAEKWRAFAGGRTIIDSTFPLMAHLSPKYLEAARGAADRADVLIISHPWVYPVVRGAIDPSRQLVVYDSHNFEALLRTELLDDGEFGSEVAKGVLVAEFELARRADLVIACSQDDCALFEEIYGLSSAKLHAVPNGVFGQKLTPPSEEKRRKAKAKLDLPGTAAIFIGSGYAPNVEATRFICEKVAPVAPEVTFVVCGGVADALELASLRAAAEANVRFIGYVTEDEKLSYLWASDMAINPMFSGSGTNIKMFDFMATGLPVVSTPVGARGIHAEVDGRATMLLAEAEAFAESVRALQEDVGLREQIGAAGRTLVEQSYSWEKISPRLGELLRESHRAKAWSDNPRGHGAQTSPSETQEDRDPRVDASANDPSPPDIAILTTWGIRCGIAENTRYLVEAFERRGINCLILSNSEPDGEDRGDNVLAVIKAWDNGHVDPKRIAKACGDASINRLSVQHHPAFFDVANLIDLVDHCAKRGVEVCVTLHNSVEMSEERLSEIVASNPAIVVHSENERQILADLGSQKAYCVPLGVLEVDEPPLDDPRSQGGRARAPVIGSFGFLRPHKGMLELIEAVDILRDLHPNIYLLGMNALFPTEDSRLCHDRCMARIKDLGLEENVHINTAFLDIAEVVRRLAVCDLIVLPYHHSTENASASVNVAAAAKRPVIVTRQRIFEDLEGFVYKVESVQPAALAASISLLLQTPALMEQLQQECERFVRANSWQAVAERYFEAICASDGEASERARIVR